MEMCDIHIPIEIVHHILSYNPLPYSRCVNSICRDIEDSLITYGIGSLPMITHNMDVKDERGWCDLRIRLFLKNTFDITLSRQTVVEIVSRRYIHVLSRLMTFAIGNYHIGHLVDARPDITKEIGDCLCRGVRLGSEICFHLGVWLGRPDLVEMSCNDRTPAQILCEIKRCIYDGKDDISIVLCRTLNRCPYDIVRLAVKHNRVDLVTYLCDHLYIHRIWKLIRVAYYSTGTYDMWDLLCRCEEKYRETHPHLYTLWWSRKKVNTRYMCIRDGCYM